MAANLNEAFFPPRRRGSEPEPLLPPSQFRQLPLEEQQAYLAMSLPERRNFVRRRFPGLLDGSSANGRPSLTTREFIDGLAALPAEVRAPRLDESIARAVHAVVAAKKAPAASERGRGGFWDAAARRLQGRVRIQDRWPCLRARRSGEQRHHRFAGRLPGTGQQQMEELKAAAYAAGGDEPGRLLER